MRPHESLERATHPLARAGVPLHHRTQDLPQSNCHFLALCAKTQIVASKPITNPPPSPREPVLINYRNLWSVHMEIRWERRGLECRHPLPSNSHLSAGLLLAGQRRKLRVLRLFPPKSLLESTDSNVEDAGLDDSPVIGTDKGQVVGRQFERDLAALAGLEQKLCESL